MEANGPNPRPSGHRRRPSWRLGPPRTVAAIAGAAGITGTLVPHIPAWACVLAGAGVVLLTAPRPRRTDAGPRLDLLHHGLARYRRRGERADVLLAAPPAGMTADDLAGLFREADTVAVIAQRRGPLVLALLDRERLDRGGLEARLCEACGAAPVFSWASFPEHGVTLESLVERCESQLPDRPAPNRAGTPKRGPFPLAGRVPQHGGAR
jgi:hypothetical protein